VTSCKYAGQGPTYVKNYYNVGTNYNALMAAVQLGPIALALDANNYTFMFYKGGIIAGGCGTRLNHAVTLVGYGVSPMGNNYWLVKNSWGSGWGEGGYFRIHRTYNYPGTCGILMMNSYAAIA
jgi:KDEL-tailed cysteine endopeptidase